MKKTLTLLAITLFSLPFFGLAQGSKSNVPVNLGPSNVPYNSEVSNVTLTVDAQDVPTLSNASYSCGGQNFDCSAMAWWLKSPEQAITVNFSEAVSTFSIVINGTNEGEVFTITPNKGAVTLSGYCADNFATVGANKLIDNAEEATGTMITVNNPTGATRYTISHNGVGNGSRLSIPDRFVPAKTAAAMVQSGTPATIFPNPTSGAFEVYDKGRVGNLEVSDMLGRHVMTVPFENQAALDLGQQAPGVYWVKITDQANRVSVQRVVRQ